MSWVASGWAKKLIFCPDGKKIRPNEKFLLLILSDYHNDKLKAAWASVATLAEDALMSKRNARYLLRRLERHGLIKTEQDGIGPKGVNRYTFSQLDDGAKISVSMGQRFPHYGEISCHQIGKTGVTDRAKAFAPKQEETIRQQEEGEGEEPPPLRDFWKEGGWEKEDRWLFNFLSRQTFLPEAQEYLLMNPLWWSQVGSACHGLSVEFLETEFAKLAAALEEGTIKKPLERKDWLRRVRKWLIDETRWREERAKRAEKKRAAE